MELAIVIIEQATIYTMLSMFAIGSFSPIIGAVMLIRLDRHNKAKDAKRAELLKEWTMVETSVNG